MVSKVPEQEVGVCKVSGSGISSSAALPEQRAPKHFLQDFGVISQGRKSREQSLLTS